MIETQFSFFFFFLEKKNLYYWKTGFQSFLKNISKHLYNTTPLIHHLSCLETSQPKTRESNVNFISSLIPFVQFQSLRNFQRNILFQSHKIIVEHYIFIRAL